MGSRRGRMKRHSICSAVICLVIVCLAAPAVSSPAGRLLPNLLPLAPEAIHGPSTGLLPFSATSVAPLVVDGCLPDEMARAGARRCLRFDTAIANVGAGPLEVAYKVDGPEVDAMQRIYRRDGSFSERFASTSEFHPTHTHFHIKDFYVSRLWILDRSGGIRGREPQATTLKNGFCPEDSSNYGGSEPRYSCRQDIETEDGVQQIVGISSGWMDVYGYNLPDQYIEVSVVEDGRYLLEISIDPNDAFKESNEEDNSVCLNVRLKGTEALVLDTRHCPALPPAGQD
jgi:hypothetical protein